MHTACTSSAIAFLDGERGSLRYRGIPIEQLAFFFHAEDGIRHRTVTGVQTCALPIYILPDLEATDDDRLPSGFTYRWSCTTVAIETPLFMRWLMERIAECHVRRRARAAPSSARTTRSEERRVGEELGSDTAQPDE